MHFDFQTPTPLEYFASLVHSDSEFALLEAAASIAHDEYTELDFQHVLSTVDSLKQRLRKRLHTKATVLERIHALNRFFYGDLGFGINANNYYDPDNSFLHHVLESRRGIPISIGVLWLELARSLGLDAHGVSFPGHFMLKVLVAQGQVILDPLTGQSFSSEELTRQLQAFIPRINMYADDAMPLALFLRSATPREIIARMLRNLKEIYRNQNDFSRLLAIQNRLVVLLPEDWDEVRDRGWTHIQLKQTRNAMDDFQNYLDHAHEALDVIEISRKLHELRQQDN